MSEPIFLTLDEVLDIHARSLAEHGGMAGMREPGLVDSALASAQNCFLAMIALAEKSMTKQDLAILFRKAAQPSS
ncbi:MAG TPA: hypothetical protein VG167_16850 [Verrucomicrobiae bacterium]|nr:hypothetical protein [Verrucomicrobiae bacterium]